MRITLTESDFRDMPKSLRETLWAFLSESAKHTAIPSADRERDHSGFDFTAAPRGSRHPGKRLVSFKFDQVKEFMRTFADQDEDIEKVLHALACTFCRHHRDASMSDISPADLAEHLAVHDEKGQPDARRVSPLLKKVTHAIRDYTSDPEAGWYTLDRAGDFYLDPRTDKVLGQYFEAAHRRK